MEWSERLDLNQRPLDPQSSALPDCATLRRGRDYRDFFPRCNAAAKRRPLKFQDAAAYWTTAANTSVGFAGHDLLSLATFGSVGQSQRCTILRTSRL